MSYQHFQYMLQQAATTEFQLQTKHDELKYQTYFLQKNYNENRLSWLLFVTCLEYSYLWLLQTFSHFSVRKASLKPLSVRQTQDHNFSCACVIFPRHSSRFIILRNNKIFAFDGPAKTI